MEKIIVTDTKYMYEAYIEGMAAICAESAMYEWSIVSVCIIVRFNC